MTRLAACPMCAAPLRDGLRFCTQCGTALFAAADARAESPAPVAAPEPAAPVAPASVPPPPVAAAAATAVAPDFDISSDFGDDAVDDPGPVFEPVPALGSLASAPAERPSILGLLAEHAAGHGVAAASLTGELDPLRTAKSEQVSEPSPASHPTPVPEQAPAHEEAQESNPAASTPDSALHPLGVPIISARRPPGPGANPAHIGRASAYGPDVVRSGATMTASPASPVSPSSVSSPVASPAAPSPSTPASLSPSAPAAPEATASGSSAVARGGRRYTPPPARSRAATWALVTGVLPLAVSIVGNLVTAELGRRAVAATEAGVTNGAWSPVFVALSLVFVVNAALLTVCAITGTRGIRETGNGITKGRALAVAGLAAGAVNLLLLVAGLAITISGLSAVLV